MQLSRLVLVLCGVWIDVCKMCFSVGRIFTFHHVTWWRYDVLHFPYLWMGKHIGRGVWIDVYNMCFSLGRIFTLWTCHRMALWRSTLSLFLNWETYRARRMNWRIQYVLQCRANFHFVNMSHDGAMTCFVFLFCFVLFCFYLPYLWMWRHIRRKV